jgi:hypothetical protein
MTLDQSVLRFAGFVVLLSLALAWAVSPYWLWRAAFAGATDPGAVHRVLPGGDGFQALRRQVRARLLVPGGANAP